MTQHETGIGSIDAIADRQRDAINAHDASAFAALYSSDAVVADPLYPEPLTGRDAVAKDIADFFAAFPDLRIEKARTLGNGDAYAIEFTLSGTHNGPLVGPTGQIPATGKRMEIGGSAIARLDAQGRIADERRYYDVAGMLRQIGLLA